VNVVLEVQFRLLWRIPSAVEESPVSAVDGEHKKKRTDCNPGDGSDGHYVGSVVLIEDGAWLWGSPTSTMKVFHKTPSSLSLFGSVSFLSRTSWTEEIHASLVETEIGVGIVDVLEIIFDAEIGNH
jgi:hypothetical protein